MSRKMRTVSVDTIQTSIDSALRSIKDVLKELDRWPGCQKNSNERRFFEGHKQALGGLRECLVIEASMLTSAQDNLKSQPFKTAQQRDQFSVDQYVLFAIIDRAAREEKTAIAARENWPRVADVARRSIYLHYRVANVIKESPRLLRRYRGHMEDLRGILDVHRGPYEIFAAHATVDKPLVQQVLRQFRARGKSALRDIKKVMATNPGNTKEIEAVFTQKQEKLDALELGAWIDIDQLALGDKSFDVIEPTIRLANTLLVFFTPRNKQGWYLHNKEIPRIERRLAEADRKSRMLSALAKRSAEENLRAIPVVLAPELWEKQEKEWSQNWRADMVCPDNLNQLKRRAKGRSLSLKELIGPIIDTLTADKNLKRMTGGLIEKSPERRNMDALTNRAMGRSYRPT